MAVYAIVSIEVHNDAEYDKYKEISGPAAAKYDGKFLVRGGKTVVKEGSARMRNVVVEFPNWEKAEAFYASDEYQKALSYALADGVSTRDYFFVEGV